ncbi:MAG: CDP-alcohol phosphatidyltransferase family protein [Chloroflexi bacterium]|nr:CDP-alcohol phosphatidyltransferase family protein [Chloroflexota bacterium]
MAHLNLPVRSRVIAWGVHGYTALGLVCAFFAYQAMRRSDLTAFFLWLAVAVLIDSTDGYFARQFHVGQALPEFDGRKLDDLTDYLTYVFLPMLAADHWALLPNGMDWLVLLPLIASGYGFSQVGAKTADSFVGFPSYWNVVVFYLLVFRWPAAMNAVILVALSLMVFWPIRYIYPTRARWLMRLTILLAGIWGALVLFALFQFDTAVGERAATLSLFFPIYYTAISLIHHQRSIIPEGA